MDEARDDEYQRLLVGLCAFIRQHGELRHQRGGVDGAARDQRLAQ